MGTVTVYYNIAARAKFSSKGIKIAFFIGKCYREKKKEKNVC